jgi:uncharacterized membrane protein YraQ (UPF0718 family)
MSSIDTAQTARALRLEWLAARIIVIGGFVIALAAGLWFGVILPKVIEPREQRAALTTRVQKLLVQEAQVCTMALGTAKNFGIVPQYGQLVTGKLALTNVQGRYLCLATTNATRYVLAIDLLCRDLGNPRCVSLYNVSQTDGTVLYQRQR